MRGYVLGEEVEFDELALWCADPEDAGPGSEGDVVPGPGAQLVQPFLRVGEPGAGVAQEGGQDAVERGELEDGERLNRARAAAPRTVTTAL